MNPTRAILPPPEPAETSTRETGPLHAAKRATPHFPHAKRDTILALLREAKLRGEGVDRAHLLFECGYTQCAARIFELEQQGYMMRHETRPGQRYVTYFLVSRPAEEKPLPAYQSKTPDKRQGAFACSSDWYERQTCQNRLDESASRFGPLFEGADR